ncbi:calcium-transporting P-type ATPase-like protein [Venturia nashicola]|uniref:P-type Ca(2+) transporter n=1 Tax=Venturia nashicola TaxID=86259 RepID=A0A4Z1PH18_9PEZI|nr:calcium-transporting P-type ATPase-like protein [Venturia nashicola]
MASRSSTPSLPTHNVPSSSTRSRTPELAVAHGSRPSSRNATRSDGSKAASSTTSEFSLLTPLETAERLTTNLASGISSTEATSRLLSHGPNELTHDEPEPLWLRFLKQFKETLILLLLGSAAISFLMGNLEDAISITVAVTIVVTVGFVQEYRSEKSLEALNQLVPHFAHIIRDDATTARPRSEPNGTKENGVVDTAHLLDKEEVENLSRTITASQLVPGDLVLFRTGDRIPADVRITHSAELSIDESNLTGENEPVHKFPERLTRPNGNLEAPGASTPFYASPATGAVGADIRLNDQHNIAFMGTLVRSGFGQGLVIGTGSNTEFGAISASLQEIESPRTPLQLAMDRLGKDLSYMSFVVIGFICLLGLWRGWPWLEIFQTGVSLAVAAIPEGLPIIVTVTLALGVLRMSKRRAIVRRLPSVETLGSVNVVCSDKTGTLTTNHMTVTKMWHFDEAVPTDVKRKVGTTDLDSATRTILRIGNIVNHGRLMHGQGDTSASAAVLSSTLGDDSSNAKSRWAGQPTDVALLDLIDEFGEDDVRARIGARKAETPFSSERKWMGVVIQSSDDSSKAYIKGAIEQVLKRCDTYITGDGREVVLDENRRQEAIRAAENMAQDGLRVLGFASASIRESKLNSSFKSSGRSTPVPGSSLSPTKSLTEKDEDIYQGLAFAGLVGMSDPPRKGVDRSIRRLMAGGVKVIMITGDAETTAVAIGRKLGMSVTTTSLGSSVLRGDQLDQMTDAELSRAIATTTIFARTSPEHKLKIVRALQARGDVVAMTGDGVNDAPALKKADIGISMGKLGTDVAKEAADMILTDDDFSTILNAIEEGKGIFYNIQNFITFQLSTSAAALSLVLASTIFGWKNPLNAMQILWINILMDGPPAQSLGVEPVDPAVMSRPPRSKTARAITSTLLQRVIIQASVIMLGTLLIYVKEMAADGIVTSRDTTMTFTCFVLFDMFNALTCRSEAKSVLRGEVRFGDNKMFNYAVAMSLCGQLLVVYFPPLQRVFQTEALGFFDLVGLVMLASSVFWVDEGRKYLKKKNSRGLGGYSRMV